ncbi:MinD/ParA family ATP-binding protein [Rhodococcus daqingensis]|uniref:MinD/ParA family protein n=1 Tax=Rhodococcus daqingensis TaxID=2479363 RepID=A0ABW2RU17_9NOCA
MLKRPRRAPDDGWRAAVHRISGGVINPGQSADEQHLQALVERVNQPIRGDYRIAFLSLKGGVGKTTTTVGLGSTFASLRGDQVIAVDANPDMGTLATRVPLQTASTVRDLLADAPYLRRYSDVRRHTSQAESRLEVLAGEQDPAVSEAFSEADYRSVIDILQVYYNIILTDCGTGIMHSAMNGVLQLANSLVLVSSPAIDGARSAAATLDWLQHHRYGHLVERTVVVISSARPGATTIDLDELSRHFLARCRAVQVVPFDEHLAEGAEIDLNLLRPATRRAFVELAAMVADDFPASAGRHAVAEWS